MHDQSTTYNYSFQTKQNMKCACLVLSKNVSVEFKRIPLSETQPRPNLILPNFDSRTNLSQNLGLFEKRSPELLV